MRTPSQLHPCSNYAPLPKQTEKERNNSLIGSGEDYGLLPSPHSLLEEQICLKALFEDDRTAMPFMIFLSSCPDVFLLRKAPQLG